MPISKCGSEPSYSVPCVKRRWYVERQIYFVTGFENEKPPSAFVTKKTHTHGVRIGSPRIRK